MSVKKRGQVFYLTFRPFGKLVYLKTAARSKVEAKQVEMALLIACKSGDYRSLNPVAREACIRLFENQSLELPPELGGSEPAKELTLWEAVQIFLNYPTIRDCAAKQRYGFCLANLVEKLGTDTPIKKLWVPDLRLYQTNRLADRIGPPESEKRVAPGTVNRELSTLSKLFSVLIELQIVDTNPVRLIKRLRPDHREVYIAYPDFQRIVEACPPWYRPVIQTAFYTGMRRGEIFGLTRKQVNLGTRIIRLGADDTKERRSKRVPIHRELVPILEEVLRLTSMVSDKVFLLRDEKGIRPLGKDSFKNPWPRACKALEKKKLLQEPFPVFHDLRHTWKTNARRSGMDPEIRESILGHWLKEKSVSERYGFIDDVELLKAIDGMTFDHGKTEIWASR